MFASLILSVVITGLLLIAGYYLIFFLAKADILFTIVEEGWCKIILEWGVYKRTIGPGRHWMGIPGINALYSRTMTFFKSVTDHDGKALAEPHDDKNISSFLTTVYAYAFPYKDEEDSHGLPLSGILAVIGIIRDYRKAFFVARDWYSMINTKVMSCFREQLVRVSYDDDIVGRDTEEEQVCKMLSERLWEALNHKKDENSLSVVEELLEVYGIEIRSVDLRSVDPPADWRATTLAPYKAQREKEAARHQSEASAILFDDTNRALKTWLAEQQAIGNKPTRAQIMEKQKELRERALAKTPGYQQLDIRGLENATTAVVGGAGGAGVILGGGAKQGKGGGKKSKKQKPQDMDRDTAIDDAFGDK